MPNVTLYIKESRHGVTLRSMELMLSKQPLSDVWGLMNDAKEDVLSCSSDKETEFVMEIDLAMARMHNATFACGYDAVDALPLDRGMLSEAWAVRAMSHLLAETYTRMTDAINHVVREL